MTSYSKRIDMDVNEFTASEQSLNLRKGLLIFLLILRPLFPAAFFYASAFNAAA